MHRQWKDDGFTLIELLVGITILSLVSLMVSQLLSASVRLRNKAATYADIQKESQIVSRRMAGAVMNAENIYMEEGEDGIILFTGKRTEQMDSMSYDGVLFWFNKNTGCLYQNSGASLEVTMSIAEVPGGGGTDKKRLPGALSVDSVRSMMEENSSKGREYLISDKVESVKLELIPVPEEKERLKEPGSYFYVIDHVVTVKIALTFQYLDSGDYVVDTSATPRNQIGFLWWKNAN